MTITSPKLDTADLTANEEARLRCQTALELKDRGAYKGAQAVMRPFWKGILERPETEGLHPAVAAEVLLCVGILTCWIGSKRELKEAQETAKNLLSESISAYESVGDVQKVAAARVELAYCYWCDGEINEARIMFEEALKRLTVESNSRARALIGLAFVESSASRYDVALGILTDNTSLFEKVTNHTLIGTYHNQLAIVFRHLALSEKRDEYLQRAISEFEEADHHFKLAKNDVFRASVKNNVGLILLNQSRFREAHKYLAEARRLSVIARDKVRTAQFDESRAQVLLAEKRLKEAESVARGAVSVLEKTGQQCLLADALITQGIALARLGEAERAQSVFERAVEVAHHVGALNKAGLAALSVIEELNEAPIKTLANAFDRCSDWLASSESADILRRLNEAARKLFARLNGELDPEEALATLINKPDDFQSQVLRFERSLIRQALARSNGSVTRAASLLGMSYQGLGYIISSRHKALLTERTPLRPRRKALFKERTPGDSGQ